MDWYVIIYFLAGGLGGFLSGLLGIGGGIVFVFVISTALSFNSSVEYSTSSFAYTVILNSIFCILFTSFSACIKLYRRGEFEFRTVAYAGIPAIIASCLVTFFLSQIVYSKDAFLIIFSIALLPILVKFLPRSQKSIQKNSTPGKTKFMVSGLFSGLGSALTGLGGGFLFNPVLHGFFGYPVKKTFAVSIGVIFLSSASILMTYLLLAPEYSNFQFLPKITFPIVLGSIIMSPIGVVTAHKLKDGYLRALFLLFALMVLINNLIEILT